MGFFVAGENFDLDGPEELRDPERPFYTVGHLSWSEDGEYFFWVSDHTLVTDAYGVALLWAMAIFGVIDNGDHPRPLVRIRSHRTDPIEVAPSDDDYVDEDEERTVTFVIPEGFASVDEEEGQNLEKETGELPELIKAMGEEPESED